MTPQELKNSILQLAIQGRLVEQRPEEGTAEELYRKIQREKAALVKAGKIKKEKPLPEITEEEVPFEIPEGWKWVRLQTITFNHGQLVPSETISYIDIGSIDNKKQCLSQDENIVSADKAPSRARRIVVMGDILYSTVRPYLHNMCIVDREFSYQPIASTGFAVMSCLEGIYNRYLFYYLMSPSFDSYANNTENAKGVAYPAINDDRLYRAVIALPPLPEQKRIVAKIEELLPLIDRYEKAWTRLEDFNKRFPADMQKSILQLAIQGRLVEQRPEEGTGEELYREIQREKEKLVKAGKIKREKGMEEIRPEEIPFEIPEGWKWVSVGDTCTNIQYGTSQKSDKTGKIIVLRMGNLQNGRIIYDKLVYSSDERDMEQYLLEYNDLLFNRTNSKELVGKTAIYKGEYPAIYAGYLVRITPVLFDSDYLNYVMQSKYYWSYCQTVRSDAIGQSNINAEKLKRFLFPLPPLAEQKRIVEKLEEMLPMCEKLKGSKQHE